MAEPKSFLENASASSTTETDPFVVSILEIAQLTFIIEKMSNIGIQWMPCYWNMIMNWEYDDSWVCDPGDSFNKKIVEIAIFSSTLLFPLTDGLGFVQFIHHLKT